MRIADASVCARAVASTETIRWVTPSSANPSAYARVLPPPP
jgi:hypothetical protein